MRNYIAEWIADLKDRGEIVYAPVELPREQFQIFDYVGKKKRMGVQSYLSFTWILSGGLGMLLGGLFAEETNLVLTGAGLSALGLLGIYWLSRGYKYRPGEPLSWGRPPKLVIFDEAGFTLGAYDYNKAKSDELKKTLGKG